MVHTLHQPLLLLQLEADPPQIWLQYFIHGQFVFPVQCLAKILWHINFSIITNPFISHRCACKTRPPRPKFVMPFIIYPSPIFRFGIGFVSLATWIKYVTFTTVCRCSLTCCIPFKCCLYARGYSRNSDAATTNLHTAHHYVCTFSYWTMCRWAKNLVCNTHGKWRLIVAIYSILFRVHN